MRDYREGPEGCLFQAPRPDQEPRAEIWRMDYPMAELVNDDIEPGFPQIATPSSRLSKFIDALNNAADKRFGHSEMLQLWRTACSRDAIQTINCRLECSHSSHTLMSIPARRNLDLIHCMHVAMAYLLVFEARLSWADQDFLFGRHSAGKTNMLFIPPDFRLRPLHSSLAPGLELPRA